MVERLEPPGARRRRSGRGVGRRRRRLSAAGLAQAHAGAVGLPGAGAPEPHTLPEDACRLSADPTQRSRAPSPSPSPDDEALIARCRSGDQDAWRALVERHAPLVNGILRGAFRLEAHDAEDAFQEVFTRLYVRLDTIRDERAVHGWIAQVAPRGRRRFARLPATGRPRTRHRRRYGLRLDQDVDPPAALRRALARRAERARPGRQPARRARGT